MTNNIFREYDIRGVVGKEIHLDKIRDLTKSILSYFLQQNPSLSRIIVGMDGRVHSPFIKKEIFTAANEMGIDVTDIGLCPTPVFYFSLFNSGVTSGLMITASHNPKEYNGLKICLDKKSVWGGQIEEIKEIFTSKSFITREQKTDSNNTYDAVGNYLDWMSDHFSHLRNKEINTIIDCGNGTAGVVFPKLVKMMGLKNVKILFEEVDGRFPNHEADPTNPKNMQEVKRELLQNSGYTLGLGLDGDSDRMNPMTHNGYLVPGDKLVALYSKKILQKHPQASIVFDIKSSGGLIEALEKMGAKPCIAPSGHTIIKAALQKHNAKLAGELSTHFFFNDRYFGYDDGIYAALRLFEILDETGKTLEELLKDFPKRVSSPEYRITCKEEEKVDIVEHVKTIFAARKDADLLTIDGVRATMPYGWGLVRASNTQPAICLRFESKTQDGLKKLEGDFLLALAPYFNEKKLREYFG
jgi:phosphomannomutase/phosphoglucomutase